LRVLGIDIGSKKIGIAISNQEMTLATPLTVVHRSSQTSEDHETIKAIAHEWEVELLVVGMPLSLDGSLGASAENVLKEIKHLERNTGIPVDTFDERFTTTTAKQILHDQGVSEKEQKNVIDQVAASIILQTWLDHKISASASLKEAASD
tara:strand:- start:2632 stop:3081 length:450 start_codon:yes stop_codon:yes gene_type:complete